jgi:hypothetical protein
MESLRISVDIHEKLIKTQRKCSWRAQLFLLGKNQYGVCDTIKALKRSTQHGCGFMPGIDADELTYVAVKLLKQKYTVGGFAYVSSSEYSEPAWGGDHGDDIYIHAGVPFLCFTGPRVLAQVSDRHGDISEIYVSVVDKNFGKPLPTKKPKAKVKITKPIKKSRKK